jgi:hypothetical protein
MSLATLAAPLLLLLLLLLLLASGEPQIHPRTQNPLSLWESIPLGEYATASGFVTNSERSES